MTYIKPCLCGVKPFYERPRLELHIIGCYACDSNLRSSGATYESAVQGWNSNTILDPDKVEDKTNPSYYRKSLLGFECITVSELLGFNLGNAFKYTYRLGSKDATELERGKIAWYVERYKQQPRAGLLERIYRRRKTRDALRMLEDLQDSFDDASLNERVHNLLTFVLMYRGE